MRFRIGINLGDVIQESDRIYGDGVNVAARIESINATLSKIGGIFVIASNSAFTYKGKPVKAQQVAEGLGVQYVLEDSIQKTADRLRLTAQLITLVSLFPPLFHHDDLYLKFFWCRLRRIISIHISHISTISSLRWQYLFGTPNQARIFERSGQIG